MSFPAEADAVVQGIEILTLRMVADTQMAGQNELREYYRRFRDSVRTPSWHADVLHCFFEHKSLAHPLRDGVARRMGSTLGAPIRCDLPLSGVRLRGRARLAGVGSHVLDRCGVVLVVCDAPGFLLAGFNPGGLRHVGEWLRRQPLATGHLPYVGAVWLPSSAYTALARELDGHEPQSRPSNPRNS